MDILPQEIYWHIFSYYSISDLIKLYVHKDPEINAILSSDYFWYHYFNSRNRPIFNHQKLFIEWVSEFEHVGNSVAFAKSEIRADLEYSIQYIKPVSILLDFKNPQLDEIIYNSYVENHEYNTSLLIVHIDNKVIMSAYNSEEYPGVIISEDYKTIFNTLVKLRYYGNQYD